LAKAVRYNDPNNLKRFAELLERTLIPLDDINFVGGLNSLDTMTSDGHDNSNLS